SRLQEDVLWLEIAVNNPQRVRVIERVRDHLDQSDHFIDGELRRSRQLCPERVPVDVRHDVKQKGGSLVARSAGSLGMTPMDCARIEERQKVRVTEVGGDLDLREESLGAE